MRLPDDDDELECPLDDELLELPDLEDDEDDPEPELKDELELDEDEPELELREELELDEELKLLFEDEDFDEEIIVFE